MPIETDSGNIDFVWRFNPNAEGQEPISYPLRLHKTSEFGQTLSFLDEENKPVFSLPADFLREVGEHISQYQGGARASLPRARTVAGVGPSIQLPKIGGKPVPIPQKTAQRPPATHEMRTPNGRVVSVSDADEVGEDTEIDGGVYLPPGHNMADVEVDPNDPVFQTFVTQPEQPVKSPTPQSARPKLSEAEILAERERAKNNPNKKPGIQKRHT